MERPYTCREESAKYFVRDGHVLIYSSQPFEDEAAVISNERRAVYDQWRTGLSPHQVKIINQYRTKGKHSRLGPSR